MAEAVDLTGKTADEIAHDLEDAPRSKLLQIIQDMAGLEPWYKASEIARRRRMNVRDVRAAIKAGKLGGGYFRRADNSMLVPASGVTAWDRSFFVSVNRKENNGSK